MMKVKEYLTEKDNIEDVAAYVNSEGLGYAITSGLSWKGIEDKRLSKYWKRAADAMDEINNILDPYLE